jgi:hypothetical protein
MHPIQSKFRTTEIQKKPARSLQKKGKTRAPINSAPTPSGTSVVQN